MKKMIQILLIMSMVGLTTLLGQTYLSGDIGGMTLSSGTEWIVSDTVFVQDGDTLIIDPGTVIKFTAGVGAWLMVERGGYIHAVGTEQAPITFTSAAENPQPGDWLAPMIYGKGTGQNPNWTVDPAHNLGVLQYIKMEYTTWSFGLYNAGTGSAIDHISTYNGGGFYIRGGQVDLSHLAVHNSASTAMYIRGGYSGEINELFINGAKGVGINSANTNGADNWSPSQYDQDLLPRSNPSFRNVTIANVLSSSIRF